jgi:hypothetical protein
VFVNQVNLESESKSENGATAKKQTL